MKKRTNAVWEMFRPGDTLARKLVKGNLLDQVDELRRQLRAQQFLSPGVPSLDYLSDDLGDVHAGRFICGEGDIDGTDFTGMAMMYPPRNGYNLGGYNSGALMVGISAADGKLYAAGGSLVIDIDAINMNGKNYSLQHTAQGDVGYAYTRLGMFSRNAALVYPTMYLEHENGSPSSEYLTNGGFETGDFTGWSTSGTGVASVVSGGAAEGTYYAKAAVDPGETVAITSSRITSVTANTMYYLTCYLFEPKVVPGTDTTMYLQLKWYDADSGGNLLQTDQFEFEATDTWDMKTNFVYSPASATSVEVVLYAANDAGASASADCKFDGISLKKRLAGVIWGDPGFLMDGEPIGMRAIPEDHNVKKPPTGFYRIYPKTDDKLYLKDDSGTEHEVGGGGSGLEVSENNATSAFNTTDTTVIAAKTVGAGSMGLNGIVKAEVFIYYRQNTGSTRQFTYTFTFGSTTISDTINVSSWADSSKYAVAKFEFVVQNIAAGGSQRMAAFVHDGGADSAGNLGAGISGTSGFQTASENTVTSDLTMKIEIAMSVASSNFGFYTLGSRFFGPS